MRRTRTSWGAFVAMAMMLVASPAAAQEDRGSGFLDSVDPEFGVVVIGGEAYSVKSFTVIADENGKAASLDELPSLGAGASSDESAVWYEAGEPTGTNPRALLRLQLTGGPPR
jgi:hypothetical protein